MNDEISNEKKVVQLQIKKKPAHKAIELVDSGFKLDACKHHHVEVDESLALLTCLDCKERLDPLHYIVGVAKKIRGWYFELEQVKKQRAELAKRQACKCQFCGKMTRIRL